MSGMVILTNYPGEGTIHSPYLIESAYHLKYLQEQVEQDIYSGKYLLFTNDINLERKNGLHGSDEAAFSGVFDGQENNYWTFNNHIQNIVGFLGLLNQLKIIIVLFPISKSREITLMKMMNLRIICLQGFSWLRIK